MQDLPERHARHLRSVPSGDDPESAPAGATVPEGQLVLEDGRPDVPASGQGPAGAKLAVAFQRERSLFAAVRLPSRISRPGGFAPGNPLPSIAAAEVAPERLGSVPSARPSGHGEPSGAVIDPGSASSMAELGPRFEALAGSDGAGASVLQPELIDQAFSRLRGRQAFESLFLPAGALRELAAVNPEAAARWLVAMLGSLHRTTPEFRLDLDLRVAVKCATSMGDATVIDTRRTVRRRNERDALVRGRPELIAAAVLGGRRSWRVRGRIGLDALARLAGQAHRLQSLIEDGVDPGPLAIWSLVAASVPAARSVEGFTFVHRTVGNASRAVTVKVAPGRPVQAAPGEAAGADFVVETRRDEGLKWAAGQADCGELQGSSAYASDARRVFEQAFSPVRQRSWVGVT